MKSAQSKTIESKTRRLPRAFILVATFMMCFLVNAKGHDQTQQESAPQATASPSPKSKRNRSLSLDITPVDVEAAHRNQAGAQPPNIEAHVDSTPKKKRGELVIAPIPMHSPAIGSGIELVIGYLFKLDRSDEVSPPSAIGIGSLFTSNGSRGAGLGAKLYLKEDRYRVTAAAGRARINYDFFGTGIVSGNAGISIPITARGTAFFGEFLRRVRHKFYLGGRFQYRNLGIAIRPNEIGSDNRPVIPDAEFEARTVALGLKASRDTRDDTTYPTRGILSNFTVDFFDQAWGSKFEYQSYKLDFNKYSLLKQHHVLAFRAMGCAANGRVPFYDLCMYGASNDLRGYTSGRYQDRRMFATQVEYRLELPKRLGLVAFAGVGGVARHLNEFRMDALLPAGGFGGRFRVTKESHLNFRVDFAVGRNGHTLTIGVGEAF